MKTIELTPNQNSKFDVDVDGLRYTMEFKYNSRNPAWGVKLSLGGATLLDGVPAVIGVMLFQGHAVPNLPQNLYMVPVDDSNADADFAGLGVRVKLVQIEEGDDINVPAV